MQRRTRDRGEQAVVVLLGLLLTVFIAGGAYVDATEDAQREFAVAADEVVGAIVDEIGLGVTAAEAARSLVLASQEVTAQEFADFVRLLAASERFPELSAVVLTTVVDAEDSDAFEDRISAMIGTPFTVVPAAPVDDQRWVVTFIEPPDGNAAAVGVDLLIDSSAREAGTRAVDELRPTMTGPLELDEAMGGQVGLAVLVPVLRAHGAGALDPDDVEGRRAQHIGFTAIFFRGDDLLRTVLDDEDGVAVSVRDRAGPVGEQGVVGTFTPPGTAVEEAARTVNVDVEVFGRPWTVAVTAVEGHGVPIGLPVLLGVGCLLLTLVLALLLGSVRSSERRAQELAAVATADLAQANADLAQANGDLARANGDLAGANGDLGDTNLNLQRSNLELSRFAHVASHDLKQPVQLILSFTELLEDLLTTRLGPEGLESLERTALEKIGQGATRMRVLIDDFLALAGVERRSELLKRVDVTGAVQQVLDLLTPEIEQVGVLVEVGPTDAVIMDPRQLVSLLQNLIQNAVKFRRAGVVPTVQVSALDCGREWVLEVTDNGIGIPDGQRGRVFEAFRRLDSHDEHEGSGVGLAICAGVVDGHGGTIQIADGIDGGCRFIVRLPQPPPTPQANGVKSGHGVATPVG